MRLNCSTNDYDMPAVLLDVPATAGAVSCPYTLRQQAALPDIHLLLLAACCCSGLQQRFQFPFNDWLKGSSVRQEIRAAGAPAAGRVNFRVAVTTSDVRGAGTDANVALVLYGEKGDTGERKLESSANDFERGKVRGLLPCAQVCVNKYAGR